MSRSGYSDSLESWELIRWRGAVKSAIRGQRGQALLRELAKAMDAMPVKRLIADELECQGEHCALGVVAQARGIDVRPIDPHDGHQVSQAFDIARALAKEVVFENDEGAFWEETPEQRWQRMRKWVDDNLVDAGGAA